VVDLDRVRVFCSFERESSLNIFLMGILIYTIYDIYIYFFFGRGGKKYRKIIEKEIEVSCNMKIL